MATATTADTARRLGRALTPDELTTVSVLLDDVENIIDARTPGGVSTLNQASLIQVEANAVIRVLRNPEGYRSEGAGGVNYTIDTRAAAGFLTVLAEEWALLGLTAPSTRGKAFSVAPTLGVPVEADYVHQPGSAWTWGWA